MAKADPHLDALILGEHPSAYLAAALLRQNSKLRIVHATIPDEPDVDRLVVINPEFFKLHALLEPLRRKLDMSAIYGLQFLSGDRNTRSEHHSKSALAYVAPYKAVRNALIKIAEAQDVEMLSPKTLVIHRLDEHGAEVTVGRAMLRPKALIVGGNLTEPQQKL